jgi:hypothetical protein
MGHSKMANIVDFRRVDPPVRGEQARAVGAVCEIIIFPGVRYERWDVAPPPREQLDAASCVAHARKRRSKKRVAEMAD